MDSEIPATWLVSQIQRIIQTAEGFSPSRTPGWFAWKPRTVHKLDENGNSYPTIVDSFPATSHEHTAGETEARNVGRRADFPQEQRRNTLLADTEDIDRNEQFVIQRKNTANAVDDEGNALLDADSGDNFDETYNQTANDNAMDSNTMRSVDDFLTPEAKRQVNALRAKYKGTAQWLKAPNGKQSNLNEAQWLLVRTPNFKQWFGDWEHNPEQASKVVDRNGEPLVVYHGSESEDFSVFNTTGKNHSKGAGAFFSASRDVAKTFISGKLSDNKLFPVFLNIKNPYTVGGNNFWSTIYEYHIYDNSRKRNVFLKNDGSNFMSKDDAEQYIRDVLNDPEHKRYSVKESYPMTTDEIARFAWKFKKGQQKRFDGVIIRNVYDVGYPTAAGVNPVSDEFIVPKSNQIKSATRNNGEYSLSNDEIYKQIIGEHGAQAMDETNGNSTLTDNSNMAKNMAEKGIKPRTIKRSTGWEIGRYDKKWRHEIPDGDLRPNAKFRLVEISNHKVWKTTLGNIFDAPELYRAYPKLRDMTVYAAPIDSAGSYNSAYKFITIFEGYVEDNGNITEEYDNFPTPTPPDVRTVLLHEIQHAIQDIEGFAQGGNPLNFEKEFKDTEDRRKKSINEINQRLAEIEEVSGFDEFLKIQEEKTKNSFPPMFWDKNISTAETEEFWKNSPYGKEYYSLIALRRKLALDNPEHKYLRTPGEREARNTEIRQNFSDEQRRNTLLSETEDDYGRFRDGAGRFFDETENETFYPSVQGQNTNSHDEIYKQVIGEHGAQIADKANGNTTLMDNLRKAKSMVKSGRNPKEIKIATGWEMGTYDKKWRYEIPDGNLNPNAKFQWHKEKEDYEDFSYWETTLGNIFDAPTLYKAYPELKNLSVSTNSQERGALYSPRFRGTMLGEPFEIPPNIAISYLYVSENGRIIPSPTNQRGYGLYPLRSTLLHEIQHAIQDIEGFAPGSNREQFEEEFAATSEQRRETKKELEQRIREIEKISGYTALEKSFDYEGKSDEEIVDYFDNFWESSPYNEEYKHLNAQWRKVAFDSPADKYLRTPGEREARNIETRQNFSDEQRRNTLLPETEDEQGRFRDGAGRFFDETENETFYQSEQEQNANSQSADLQDNPLLETYRQVHTFGQQNAENAYRNLQRKRKPSAKDKLKALWVSLKDSIRAFHADFPLLADERAKAKGLIPAREYLRIMNRNISAKAHTVAGTMHKYLHGMSAEQLDIFSRVLFLSDIRAFANANPNQTLPLGYTAATLDTEYNQFLNLAKADPKVISAARAVYTNNRKIRDVLVNLALKNGLKSFADRLKADDLLFIQYARLLDGNDFNSNYVQAVGEMQITMLQDIERLSMLSKLRAKNYDKKAELVAAYGNQWRAHIPKGYSLFNPLDGHFIFNARSLTENVLGAALDNVCDLLKLSNDTKDKLHEKISRPFSTQLMVLPNELTKTLEKLSTPTQRGFFSQAFQKISSGWKQYTLYFFTRAFKYNFRNLTGDFDALLAGDPSALKYTAQSLADLTTAYYGDPAKVSKELREFQARGGALTIQSAQEIGDYKELKQFNDLISELATQGAPAWKKLPRQAINLLDKFLWSGIQKFSDFREQWFRYAAYLDYLHQMQNNNGVPNNWGASDKNEVMAIDDLRDRAFKMANELLGAYDQISEMGRKMRQFLFPFYSWIEVNAKRYVQLLKNGITQDVAGDFASKYLKGFMVNIPYFTYKLIKTMFFIHLFSMLVKAFNQLWAGDAESKLPPDIQESPHMTFGQDKDGNVYYFNKVGALGDFLDWFGFDSSNAFVKDVADIFNGNKSPADFAKQVAAAPFNKFVNALTPLIKTPLELLTGYQTFPDPAHPRPIKDRLRYIAQPNGLSWPYKWATGQEINYRQDAENAFVYTSRQGKNSPEQSAYFHIKDRVREFNETVYKAQPFSGGGNDRTPVLRKVKAAIRAKDKNELIRSLDEFYSMGGTEKSLKASLRSLDPLSGLNAQKKAEFRSWLPKNETALLKTAETYYKDIRDFYRTATKGYNHSRKEREARNTRRNSN